jgi:hypothetical protein
MFIFIESHDPSVRCADTSPTSLGRKAKLNAVASE